MFLAKVPEADAPIRLRLSVKAGAVLLCAGWRRIRRFGRRGADMTIEDDTDYHLRREWQEREAASMAKPAARAAHARLARMHELRAAVPRTLTRLDRD